MQIAEMGALCIFTLTILLIPYGIHGYKACEIIDEQNSCRIDAICYDNFNFNLRDMAKDVSDCEGSNAYVGNGGELHVKYRGVHYDSLRQLNYEELYYIVELNFDDNLLSETPELPGMINLRTLSLERNALTSAKLFNQYEVKSLIEINFSHNTINTIAIDTSQHVFNGLKILNISNNYLVNIPDAIFDAVSSLSKLDLSHNYIDVLNFMTFEGIKHLTYLNLNHNRISHLNLSLLRFRELEELYLANNKITNINAHDFEHFNSLRVLDLSQNLIVNIEHNAFQNMRAVIHIYLSYNKIETLDKDTLRNLSSLEIFDISMNNLRMIPKEIFKDNAITSLLITGNKVEGCLTKLTFQGLKKITDIDLSFQALKILEDYAFYGLANLQSLLLNNNAIETISPKSFRLLNQLNQLDLSNNYIVSLNFEKVDLVSLESLALANNMIKHIEQGDFSNLNILRHMDLTNNYISHFETESFKSLGNLINLKISNNPINGSLDANTFSGLNSLPILDISQTILTTIKNASFRGMKLLTDLNVSNSEITDIQYNSFIYTESIEILDLSHNKLMQFNVNTSHLIQLKQLILNNNLISSFCPETLKGLFVLSDLIISNNRVKSITVDAFDNQKDLRNLDLSYNPTLSINMSIIQSLSSLYNLFLSGASNKINFNDVKNSKITKLVLSHGNFNNITAISLKNLNFLNEFDISSNNITELKATDLIGLAELRELDISYNQIQYIQPGSFKDNTLLLTVNISHNYVKTITYGTFTGLNYLKTIDLSYNEIKSLKSDHFYEISGLTNLFADHNNIDYVGIEEFTGTNLAILSIGDNPLPCEVLMRIKKGYETSFTVTAIKKDYHSENVDGVTCNKSRYEKTPSNYDDITINKTQDVMLKAILSNIPIRFQEEKVLQDIRDILINASIISKNKTISTHNQTSDNQYERLFNATVNLTLSIQHTNEILNQSKTADSYSRSEVNKTNELLIILLQVINNTKPLYPQSYVPATKQAATQIHEKIETINKVSDESLKFLNNKFDELENKIRDLNSRIDKDKVDSFSVTTIKPKNERLTGSGYLNSDSDYRGSSSMFTDTCVALILLILVGFVLYKIYKSKRFVPSRRSMSTREIVNSMESSNL